MLSKYWLINWRYSVLDIAFIRIDQRLAIFFSKGPDSKLFVTLWAIWCLLQLSWLLHSGTVVLKLSQTICKQVGMAIKLAFFKLIFYFKILIDSQEVKKIIYILGGFVRHSSSSPNGCTTTQYHHQEMDAATIYRVYSDFSRFTCICLYVYLYTTM